MRELLNKLFEVVSTKTNPEVLLVDYYKKTVNTKLTKVKTGIAAGRNYLKFWLLTNGDVVPVTHTHDLSARPADTTALDLLQAGAFIGAIFNDELSLSGSIKQKFTVKQISRLKNIYVEYRIAKLVVDAGEYFSVGIKSPKELAYYLEYGNEEFESKIEGGLLEKILVINEFDIKKGLRTAAVAGLIGAVPLGLGYKKGLSQKPVEKPAAIAPAEIAVEWQTISMRVTAYCPCVKCTGEDSPGITASGHEIQSGDVFVAADKRYSFGTEMIVPGYNDDQPVEVLDRGGAIQGDRIDVFFPTHEEALEWGVQDLDVKVQSD